MATIIEKLQQDALDTNVPVTELLMRCVLAATKLAQQEFASWARCELDGYGKKRVPKYRLVLGTPQARNPYRGFEDIVFEDPKQKERVSTMHFNQPISEIEQSMQATKASPGGIFMINYHPSTERKLMDAMKTDIKPVLSVPAGQIGKIMTAVRKIVLEWSLKLEADGIQGLEVNFSEEEKQKASAITYNVKTLIQGTISNSQLQISSSKATQLSSIEDIDLTAIQKVVETIEDSVEKVELDQTAKESIKTEIVNLKREIVEPTPRPLFIKEALSTIRTILEGAASDLIAAGLLYQIQRFLGM